jgi:arsenate reductase
MAEGLARASAPQGWDVHSAGSEPGLLHPLAIEAMREVGIDIGAHHSKGFDEVPLGSVDVVVTLCTDEVCPTTPPNVKRLHWPLTDPAGEGDMIRHQLEAFRTVRDEIKQRLEGFWTEHAA